MPLRPAPPKPRTALAAARRPGETKLIISPVKPAAPGSPATRGELEPSAELYGAVARAIGAGGLGFGQRALIDYLTGLHASLHERDAPSEMSRAAKVQAKAMAKLIADGLLGWANRPDRPGSVLVEAFTGVVITGMDKKRITREEAATFPRTRDISFEEYKTQFKEFEDNFSHMYLDHLGNVTIGWGTLLPSVQNALEKHREFGFVRKADVPKPNLIVLSAELRRLNAGLGRLVPQLEERLERVRARIRDEQPAREGESNLVEQERQLEREIARVGAAHVSADRKIRLRYPGFAVPEVHELEVVRDFLAVLTQRQPEDRPNSGRFAAGAFADVTRLELPQQHRTTLYRRGYTLNLGVARRALWDDAWPVGVKLVYADMTYQLGGTGVVNGYPRFKSALSQRDWAQAAIQSRTSTKENHPRDVHKRILIASAHAREPFFVGISRTEKSFVEVLINRPDGVPQTVAPFPFRGRPAPDQ